MMSMNVRLKSLLVFGYLFLLALHFQTAPSISSSGSFEIAVQPAYHFLEPGEVFHYTDIIRITSTTGGQVISISWTSTSPFLEVIYDDTIQLDEMGVASVGYSLDVLDTIPSGDYHIEYELNNNAGIAYGGFIPVRVFHESDADVIDIQLQALSPFADIRYSEIKVSMEYQGVWHTLTPSLEFTHDLRLITGEYEFVITDVVTGIQIKDFQTLTVDNHGETFDYTLPLIHFVVQELTSSEIEFSVTNYLGVQNSELIIADANDNNLAEFRFIISNGINQLKFPMPVVSTDEVKLIFKVESYTQIVNIELTDSTNSGLFFPIGLLEFGIIFVMGSVIAVKLIGPRLPLKRSPKLELFLGLMLFSFALLTIMINS